MWFIVVLLAGFFVASFAPGLPSGPSPTSLKDFEQAVIDCQNQDGVKDVFTRRINFSPKKITVTCNNNIEVVRNTVQ